MKYVWFVQNYVDMRVLEVFTTRKAAFAVAKEYGKGRFQTIDKGRIYHYYTQDDRSEYACSVEKVPVHKATRKTKGISQYEKD